MVGSWKAEKPARFLLLSIIIISNFCLLTIAQETSSVLDYNPDDCTRSCQTDFSGESCWKRPMNFFVADMVHSVQNYLKLVKALAISDVDRQVYLRVKGKLQAEYEKLLNKTDEQVEESLTPLEDNEVTNLTLTYQHVFEYIRKFSDKLYEASSNSIVDSQVETFPTCPNSPCTKRTEDDPGNSDEELSEIRKFEILTYIVVALFFALAAVYLLVYILLERFTILNYKTFKAAEKALLSD